ncbi:hypothetical protein GQL56_28045, partial [Pseudomonas putida]|nr:hypothetical protein [Pseudomonas putida]
AVKGNLIYEKFKFIVSANYSVALEDKNIDKSLVFYLGNTSEKGYYLGIED